MSEPSSRSLELARIALCEDPDWMDEAWLARVIDAARAEERERCARIALGAGAVGLVLAENMRKSEERTS